MTQARSPWRSRLAVASLAFLLAETVTGLALRFAPFHAWNQWNVLIHTAIGALFLVPVVYYSVQHWQHYRKQGLSDLVLIGYFATLFLATCLVSGVVVTVQALASAKTSSLWRDTHLITTLGLLGSGAAHLVLSYFRSSKVGEGPNARAGLAWSGIFAVASFVLIILPGLLYGGRINYPPTIVISTAKIAPSRRVSHARPPEARSTHARCRDPNPAARRIATPRSSKSGVPVRIAMRRWTPSSSRSRT
jgi:hypothetical protein